MKATIRSEPVYFCSICDVALPKLGVGAAAKLMHYDYSKPPYNIKCANNGMQLDMPSVTYSVNAVPIAEM